MFKTIRNLQSTVPAAAEAIFSYAYAQNLEAALPPNEGQFS